MKISAVLAFSMTPNYIDNGIEQRTVETWTLGKKTPQAKNVDKRSTSFKIN